MTRAQTGDDFQGGPDDIEGLRARPGEWEFWRRRMEKSGRREAGRRAGLWALDVLESHLGSDWLVRVIAAEGLPPAEVAAASHDAVAYVELLRLAAHLELGAALPGYARVRTAMRTDLREERRVHTMMQLEIATLASSLGADVALEHRTLHRHAPIDVVANLDDTVLSIETFAVLHDDQLRTGRELADRVSAELRRIMFTNDVHLVGEIGEDFTDEAAPAIVAAVEVAAAVAAETQAERRVEHPVADLRVVPRAMAESGTGYGLPAGTTKGWSRTAAILRKKAEPASDAGASWLRVDLHDSMWQLSPWAQSRLAAKTHTLGTAVHDALQGTEGVRGVVLSSGAATALGTRVGETTWPTARYIGMRRDLGAFRAVKPSSSESLTARRRGLRPGVPMARRGSCCLRFPTARRSGCSSHVSDTRRDGRYPRRSFTRSSRILR